MKLRVEEFVPPRWSLSPSFELDNAALSSFKPVYVPDVIYESGGSSVRANFADPYLVASGNPENRNVPRGVVAAYGRPSTTGYQPMTILSSTGGIYIGPFSPGETVSFKLKMRVIIDVVSDGSYSSWPIADGKKVSWTAIPGIAADPPDPNLATAGVSDMLEFRFNNFEVDPLKFTDEIVSLEVNDPRVSRKGANWVQAADETMGFPNSNYTGDMDGNDSDLSRPPGLLQFVRGRLRGRLGSSSGNWPILNLESQSASSILGFPGVGYLSSVPTGIDSGTPWATFKFFDAGDPVPDWLLWNYFYVPFDRSIANQTDGKMNINATLWPWKITRTKPLEALLGNRVANPATLATAIATTAAGAKSIGPDDLFVYQGQIMTAPGMSDGANEYLKESLARSLADIVTTQCDDYRVFVTAESIKEGPGGRLTTVATKRIEATLSRSVDEGGSGMYPTMLMQGPQRFDVFTRSGYQASGANASRLNVYNKLNIPLNKQFFTGPDGQSGTSDDWIIPQKIKISDLRYLE